VTLGFRITEGETTLCYIPDHEPALGASIEDAADGWISGLALADGASVLIHDGQYDDDEYPGHVGWGHSALSDALAFAGRARAQRLVLFHHDPTHDDATLDELEERARESWRDAGGDPRAVSLAREGTTISV
jgi:ribonuclease BN (tRNA processing enzyme)